MSIPAAAPRTWTFTIDAPQRRVCSANTDRAIGTQGRMVETREWKRSAYYEAKKAKVPRLGRARIALTIRIRGWRNADSQNFPSASSVKGLIDGLVAAGVLPDDRPVYLDMPMPTLAPLGGWPPRIDVTITEVAP